MSSEYWYVYFCVPSKGPHLLWIVAPRRKTVEAPGFTMSTVGSAPPQAICDWEALHGYRLGETVRSDVERTFVLGTLWLGFITVIYNWLFIAVVANGNLLKQSLEMSHWIIKALRSKWKGFSSLWTRKRSALQIVRLIFAIMGSLKGFINMLSTQPAYSQTNEGSSSGELECALHLIVICPLDFEMSSLWFSVRLEGKHICLLHIWYNQETNILNLMKFGHTWLTYSLLTAMLSLWGH